MLLLGIELLNMRLEGQCLNHWAIWAIILHQQKILNKNNFTYRGIFAICTHKQLVVQYGESKIILSIPLAYIWFRNRYI